MTVVKQVIKIGGGCIATALIFSKIVSPYLVQVQKIRTEELFSDESIIRRFEQSLLEGDSRFSEEISFVTEMIKSFFNIESLTERLNTCKYENKLQLWNEMKTLLFARLMITIYMNYTTLIFSKAQMVLIAKSFSKGSTLNEDQTLDSCRIFMDEMKGFYATLTAELCPKFLEICENVLKFTDVGTKLEDIESSKTILYQLKRQADASFSISDILFKYCLSQISPSSSLSELLVYSKSRNFSELHDYMVCDGLDEVVSKGHLFVEQSGKAKLLITLLTFYSAIFGTSCQDSIEDILVKKWKSQKSMFSHLAILFCNDFNVNNQS